MASLRERYPLESRKPLKKTFSEIGASLITIITFAIGVFIVLIQGRSAASTLQKFNFWPIFLIFVALIILALILKYVYEVFYMKYYFYDLVGKNLVIKKGVFSRSEITLPVNRLQDVYVDQDILDRILQLYDVHVSSATMISGNLAHMDGLSKENAQSIKNLILSGIQKENG